MPKQVFLARFELAVALFGPPKVPKCLENGLFGTKNGSKMGQKLCFSKNDPRPFGVPEQVKRAHFEPIASHFGPSKVTKCLENAVCATKNGSKMGQKCVFPKVILDHLGCVNK